MGQLLYKTSACIGRSIFCVTMNLHVLHPERAEREGAYILACTHISHLEPFMLSLTVRREIDWMARKEYFHNPITAWLVKKHGAFCVHRYGVPVSAIRTSLKRLEMGRCLGICPEGGTAQGSLSVMRGGPIKRGVCLLSYRAKVPVVPCVILGTDKLNAVMPWIPFRRASLWLNFGEPILPPLHITDRREARRVMAGQLTAAYIALYGEVRRAYNIDDADVP